MQHKLKKGLILIRRNGIKIISFINTPFYMKLYIKHLKSLGMNITGNSHYISSNVKFDGSDYSLISIGDHVGISRDVLFLTHDFSMNTVCKDIDLANQEIIDKELKKNNLLVLKKISIGDNTFIGARVTVLQGTSIGRNCLIGAGSVIKGDIPDFSVVAGNPATIIANTKEWLENKNFK